MRRLISLAIGITLLVLVIHSQSHNFSNLLDTQVNANWKWGLISFIFFFIHGYMVFFAWNKSLNYYHIDIPTKEVAQIHFISLISRYLPGGIWHIAGRVVAVASKGFDIKKVLSTLYHEQIIAVLSCLFLVTTFFWIKPSIYSGIIDFPFNTWVILITFVLFVLMLFPKVLTYSLNFLFKVLQKNKVEILTRQQYYQLFNLHTLSMLFFIAGYYFSARIYINNPDVTQLAGVIMLATFIGFIAIFVPSGLGVREGIFIAYLNLQGIDGSIAISVALLPRVLILSAELMSVLIATMYMGFNKKNVEQ